MLVIVAFIVSPKTLKKIISKKKLFTKMIKLIQKMLDLPRIKNPISYIDWGRSGQICLALRNKTLLKIT